MVLTEKVVEPSVVSVNKTDSRSWTCRIRSPRARGKTVVMVTGRDTLRGLYTLRIGSRHHEDAEKLCSKNAILLEIQRQMTNDDEVPFVRETNERRSDEKGLPRLATQGTVTRGCTPEVDEKNHTRKSLMDCTASDSDVQVLVQRNV